MDINRYWQINFIVEEIKAEDFGGFAAILSNGYKLEVFPDSSEDDEDSEHWRFFNPKGLLKVNVDI
ncbi:hypothetical protein [Sutcliffiella rhizosphaerae]|uniref:Uncharacterized protein n=1 Tax=Sutcliffiella rhizosphaerae TaxID=2880967 RepID=A0ABN8AKQ3_9BACI|nr:hypothetical protein [Sutcliffiella rhizosphaerae]CAG9623723.1 hypothetical protein BACCIP111883_04555 [Sutcliffiella rhizosphaerae]